MRHPDRGAHFGMDYKRVQRVPSKPETLQIGKAGFHFGFDGPSMAAVSTRSFPIRRAAPYLGNPPNDVNFVELEGGHGARGTIVIDELDVIGVVENHNDRAPCSSGQAKIWTGGPDRNNIEFFSHAKSVAQTLLSGKAADQRPVCSSRF